MPAGPQTRVRETGLTPWLMRLEIRHSPRRVLHGVETVVSRFSPSATINPSFERVDAALSLIERHAPVRWKQINQDVRCIFVMGGMGTWGVFYRDIATVVVNREAMLRPDHTVAHVASIIAHEAQHGRLFRLGFGYEIGDRARVERICLRAQRSLCRRLPGAAAALADASYWLSAACEEDYSDRSLVQHDIDGLATQGVPNWVIRSLTRLADWRFGTRPESPDHGAPTE